jgi:acyl-CoA thioesterase-2
MDADVTSLHQLLELEPHGPDTYVGISATYPWGRVYGGQVVAQALRAATLTVDPAYRPHSLHAYFIRGGDSDETIRFEVDRIRNGRSFVTRRVVARQSFGAILNLSASFQVDEAEADVQTLPPASDVSGPAGIEPDEMWIGFLERRWIESPADIGRSTAWLKVLDDLGDLGDDPSLHACALAYTSDDIPTDAVYRAHPDHRAGDEGQFMGASLDHAMWFHRPAPADEWQLHDFTCHGLSGGRGLTIGQVHAPDGRHVATVAQQVLVRVAR